MGNYQPLSKFANNTHDNNLKAPVLIAPEGPLTRWRQAYPDGDPISWQREHATPLFSDMKAYDLHNPTYSCVHEGFAGVMYRVNMRLGGDSSSGDPHAQGMQFTVFSIDTPRPAPRTAVRPTGLFDSHRRARGYQGVKTDDKEFDKQYHIQSEDPGFVQALLTPAFRQYLQDNQLRAALSFVFDCNTPSTWNWARVTDADGSPYLLDYTSMMIDYLVQIMRVSPRELWG